MKERAAELKTAEFIDGAHGSVAIGHDPVRMPGPAQRPVRLGDLDGGTDGHRLPLEGAVDGGAPARGVGIGSRARSTAARRPGRRDRGARAMGRRRRLR